MIRHTVLICTLILLAAGAASQLQAQSWETPTFFSPTAHDDAGLYLIDAEGADLGFMGIWRQSGRIGLGVRAGMGGRENDHSALLGVELWAPLITPQQDQPLTISWIVGGGAAFSDGFTWLRVPAGISIGVEIPGPSFVLVPYAHPRVSLDMFSFDLRTGEEETDSELNLDVDLGADLAIGGSWVARIGVTVGKVDAFGIGLAYRIPRGVSVR